MLKTIDESICVGTSLTLSHGLHYLSSHGRRDVLTPVSMYQSQVIMCLVDCTNVGLKKGLLSQLLLRSLSLRDCLFWLCR